MLDRAEAMAAEFFGDRVGARWILIDYANQLNCFEFASELVVDAGMVASECAYADNGNGNRI